MCSITTNLFSTDFNHCPKNTFNVKLKLPDRAAFIFLTSLPKAAIKGRGPGISLDYIQRYPRLLCKKTEEKEDQRKSLSCLIPLLLVTLTR